MNRIFNIKKERENLDNHIFKILELKKIMNKTQ